MTKPTSSPLVLGIWTLKQRYPRTLFPPSVRSLQQPPTIPVLTTFIWFLLPRQSGEAMHSGGVVLFGEQTSSPPRTLPQAMRYGEAMRFGEVTHCGVAIQTRASMHCGAVTRSGGVTHFGVAQPNVLRLAFQ